MPQNRARDFFVIGIILILVCGTAIWVQWCCSVNEELQNKTAEAAAKVAVAAEALTKALEKASGGVDATKATENDSKDPPTAKAVEEASKEVESKDARKATENDSKDPTTAKAVEEASKEVESKDATKATE